MKYWKYLKYVLRHKYYVFCECFKMGVTEFEIGLILRGLLHDGSKFYPDEFVPYANHFYGAGRYIKTGRDSTGYYKPTDTGDAAFDFAWLLHQKRNKHHWQWWCLPEDDGGIKILEMPRVYMLEMICDWLGAGKAQGFLSPPDDKYLECRKWYDKNKGKMMLGPLTRREVECIINDGKDILTEVPMLMPNTYDNGPEIEFTDRDSFLKGK